MDDAIVTSIVERLSRIEEKIDSLLAKGSQAVARRSYTPEEFAQRVGRATYTVREWCRGQRIDAMHGHEGRGGKPQWRIPHVELERYLDEGLLPPIRRKRV